MTKETLKTTAQLGKMRRLQQCATSDGTLSLLAVDHRDSLRRAIDPEHPDSIPDDDLVALKQLIVSVLGTAASAVLLDPEYGAPNLVASGSLASATGLVISLEQSGYAGEPTARLSRLLPDWSVDRIACLGASAAKLLVYYHPDSPTASQVEDLVRELGHSCLEAGMPLFLEPLSYALDPTCSRLSAPERRRVVVQTARKLTAIPGVDVLKAEFPLDIESAKDEVTWVDACEELTRASQVPWVLLSAGVDFETYLRQVTVATRAGASGVAVGRAVWKEVLEVEPQERTSFLRVTARSRIERLTALCRALASPWPVASRKQARQTDPRPSEKQRGMTA
jgi:tagatose-1,6-bisphosphate aldolase